MGSCSPDPFRLGQHGVGWGWGAGFPGEGDGKEAKKKWGPQPGGRERDLKKQWSSLRAPPLPGPSPAPPSMQWNLTLQMLASEERPLWPPGPLSQVTVCLSSTAIERL